MKLKSIILMCGLTFAAALAGCGDSDTGIKKEQVKEITENSTGISEIKEITEAISTSEATEITRTEEITETAENIEATDTTKAVESTGADEDFASKTIQAYQDILQSAPAIVGEHEELNDASFGYEQNEEMFGKHYDMFVIHDINNDGVDELIATSIVNFRWSEVSVFTYVNGEAVLLKTSMGEQGNSTFSQCSTANGYYSTYICENNHIHSFWRGTNAMGEEATENSAFAIEGSELVPVECEAGEDEAAFNFYDRAKENTAAE